jgi:hypothetical protein
MQYLITFKVPRHPVGPSIVHSSRVPISASHLLRAAVLNDDIRLSTWRVDRIVDYTVVGPLPPSTSGLLDPVNHSATGAVFRLFMQNVVEIREAAAGRYTPGESEARLIPPH